MRDEAEERRELRANIVASNGWAFQICIQRQKMKPTCLNWFCDSTC